jgi:hypothetical protein
VADVNLQFLPDGRIESALEQPPDFSKTQPVIGGSTDHATGMTEEWYGC